MYESARNTKCVKCSLKANEGFLYPLTKSFVFINKPTLVIGYDDIDSVEFKRDNTSSKCFNRIAFLKRLYLYIYLYIALRNFEIAVSLKAGSRSTAEGKELVFAAIDKSEYQLLLGFLTSKRLNIITTEV
jgi:structure-specific recognition protein 1